MSTDCFEHKFNVGDRVAIKFTNPGRIGEIFAVVPRMFPFWQEDQLNLTYALQSWHNASGINKDSIVQQPIYFIKFDKPISNLPKGKIKDVPEELRTRYLTCQTVTFEDDLELFDDICSKLQEDNNG
jgi:hypothetical protein